jgi:hypothetical protein
LIDGAFLPTSTNMAEDPGYLVLKAAVPKERAEAAAAAIHEELPVMVKREQFSSLSRSGHSV